MSKSKCISPCPIAKKCGACQLSNMDYERQLAFKQASVVKLLKAYGRVGEIIGMSDPYHYRNKAQFAVRKASNGRIITGIYQSSTDGIVVTDSCMLNDPKANEIARYIRSLMEELLIEPYHPRKRLGVLRHILIRSTESEYMVTLVCSSVKLNKKEQLAEKICLKFPEVSTVTLNVNTNKKMMLGSEEQILNGCGYIEDVICGKRFRISPRSFLQINHKQTEVLYKTAIDFAKLTGGEKILDAYCGTGTIGICAAEKAGSLVGVEINEQAIADARINADLNGVINASFYAADAAKFMQSCDESFDVVFTDPPRAGCSREFLTSLVRHSPKKIVYISCNPETLARDLYFLTSNGYKVRKMQPVDIFPHTKHIETVVSMTHNYTGTAKKE